MRQRLLSFFRRLKISLLVLCVVTITFLPAQTYEHIILYGQSLSTGHQSWPPLSTLSVSDNFMIGNQVWINLGNTDLTKLTPLVANVAVSTVSLPKTRASMICAEAPIVAMTNHIQLKTKGQYKFIASSCGYGGRTVEQLSKEHYSPTHYADFTKAINAASSAVNNIHCPAIVWMQGEYNYVIFPDRGMTPGSNPTDNKATYKTLLLTLKDNMQADIMKKYHQSDVPLFITYQVGAQYTRGTTVSIGMAQLEASNENEDVICAGPVYQMTDRGGHLDTNGYRWYGEMLGKAYYRTKVLGQDFKPLQPLELARTDDPKVLKIKFLVPELPLVLDERLVAKEVNYGFELYVNGAKKSIAGVLVDNDCVYINATTDLVGDVEVIYAGTSTKGNGNLRDSDSYTALYNYIDLDEKNQDGSFVYARDMNETTLRPAYEPKDAAGVIYDKPYPLYNFCVAFYYQLKADEQVYQVPNLNTNTAISPPSIDDTTSVSFSDGNLFVTTTLQDYKGVELMELSGKKLIAYTKVEESDRFSYIYSAPQLTKGVYLVNVQTTNSILTSKLIVQ